MEVALDVCNIGHNQQGWPVWVVLTNEEILPVTNWYDEDGNNLIELSGVYPAWIVAGPSAEKYWFTVETAEYTNLVARVN